MIQEKIQTKTQRTLAVFLSLYFTTCFERLRDWWPRCIKSREWHVASSNNATKPNVAVTEK